MASMSKRSTANTWKKIRQKMTPTKSSLRRSQRNRLNLNKTHLKNQSKPTIQVLKLSYSIRSRSHSKMSFKILTMIL